MPIAVPRCCPFPTVTPFTLTLLPLILPLLLLSPLLPLLPRPGEQNKHLFPIAGSRDISESRSVLCQHEDRRYLNIARCGISTHGKGLGQGVGVLICQYIVWVEQRERERGTETGGERGRAWVECGIAVKLSRSNLQ